MEKITWKLSSSSNGKEHQLKNAPGYAVLLINKGEAVLTFPKGDGLEFIESVYQQFDINGFLQLTATIQDGSRVSQRLYDCILSSYCSDGWETKLLCKLNANL